VNKFIIKTEKSWYTDPITKTNKKAIFLFKPIISFYNDDYIPGDKNRRETFGNVEYIINTLKNQFLKIDNYEILQAKNNFIQILKNDLPKILTEIKTTQINVCVVPRSKKENMYSPTQLFFKQSIKEAVMQLSGLIDGTNYIIRHSNTRTTHLDRSGYGGDGDMPYPGITKNTCNISDNVKHKDILLIDDLYTEGVNVDEDAIQALFEKGARNVYFYSLGRTVKKKKKELNIVSDECLLF